MQREQIGGADANREWSGKSLIKKYRRVQNDVLYVYGSSSRINTAELATTIPVYEFAVNQPIKEHILWVK